MTTEQQEEALLAALKFHGMVAKASGEDKPAQPVKRDDVVIQHSTAPLIKGAERVHIIHFTSNHRTLITAGGKTGDADEVRVCEEKDGKRFVMVWAGGELEQREFVKASDLSLWVDTAEIGRFGSAVFSKRECKVVPRATPAQAPPSATPAKQPPLIRTEPTTSPAKTAPLNAPSPKFGEDVGGSQLAAIAKLFPEGTVKVEQWTEPLSVSKAQLSIAEYFGVDNAGEAFKDVRWDEHQRLSREAHAVENAVVGEEVEQGKASQPSSVADDVAAFFGYGDE